VLRLLAEAFDEFAHLSALREISFRHPEVAA
jgi:hypothetical protein